MVGETPSFIGEFVGETHGVSSENMLTEMVEYGHKIEEKSEGYAK